MQAIMHCPDRKMQFFRSAFQRFTIEVARNNFRTIRIRRICIPIDSGTQCVVSFLRDVLFLQRQFAIHNAIAARCIVIAEPFCKVFRFIRNNNSFLAPWTHEAIPAAATVIRLSADFS